MWGFESLLRHQITAAILGQPRQLSRMLAFPSLCAPAAITFTLGVAMIGHCIAAWRARRVAWVALGCLLALANTAGGASAQNAYRVVKAVQGKIAPGRVAFVDTVGRRIVELDRAGKVTWSWSIPRLVIGGGDLRSGADLEWVRADNSFLLVVPLRGVFRVSRAGKVTWQHLTRKISHDADLLPNGNVLYVHGWDARSDAQAYEVDTNGKLVWSWTAAGKVDQAWHKPVTVESRPSYAHTNAAVRLQNGDTLISLRNFNRVVRVTPEGEIRRVFGPIPRVHEPTLRADGTFIASPHTRDHDKVIINVKGEGRRDLFKNTMGIKPIRTVEPLSNGNYLLTGGEEIVEIDGAGEVVWHVAIYSKAGRGDRGHNRGSRSNPGIRGVYKAAFVDTSAK